MLLTLGPLIFFGKTYSFNINENCSIKLSFKCHAIKENIPVPFRDGHETSPARSLHKNSNIRINGEPPIFLSGFKRRFNKTPSCWAESTIKPRPSAVTEGIPRRDY